MAGLFCSLILFLTLGAQAQTPEAETVKTSALKLPELLRRIKLIPLKDGPAFEESFHQTVKSIENAIEEEKLHCSGETADEAGKIVSKEQKPLCMRELKKNYLEAMDSVFEVKKNYLGIIHQKHMETLSEIHKRLKDDIGKNF